MRKIIWHVALGLEGLMFINVSQLETAAELLKFRRDSSCILWKGFKGHSASKLKNTMGVSEQVFTSTTALCHTISEKKHMPENQRSVTSHKNCTSILNQPLRVACGNSLPTIILKWWWIWVFYSVLQLITLPLPTHWLNTSQHVTNN